MKVGDTTYKIHLDGYNLRPLLTSEVKASPRKEFFYFDDDSDLVGLRYDNWKIVFAEQRATGTMKIWMEPFVTLRVPQIFNLRTDPYERADITSNTYYDWMIDRAWLVVPAQAYAAQMLQTLVEFPPSQKPASFTIEKLVERLQAGMPSS